MMQRWSLNTFQKHMEVKMTDLFLVLFLLSLAAIILGLVKPSIVTFWGRRRSRRRSSAVYGIAALAFFVAFGLSAPQDENPGQPLQAPSSVHTTNTKSLSADHTSVSGAAATAKTISSNATVSAKSSTKTSLSNSSRSSSHVTGKLIPVVVSKNTDGDTIHVRLSNGQDKTIRMLLIDTPEDVKPGTPIEPYSLDAAAYAKKVLPVGKHIYIQEGKPGYTQDKYGRLLAYVFITKSDMYNEDVVHKGLARVAYIYPPNTDYLSALEADQSYAKARHLYIWSIPGYVTSSGYSVKIAKQWDAAHHYGGYSSSSTSSSSSNSKTKSSSNGSGTLSVISSTLTVSRRSYASVTVKAKPGARGTIAVDYKSGPSHAKGLDAQTANSQGLITWRWEIGSSTTVGTWPVHISANGKTITLYLHVK